MISLEKSPRVPLPSDLRRALAQLDQDERYRRAAEDNRRNAQRRIDQRAATMARHRNPPYPTTMAG